MNFKDSFRTFKELNDIESLIENNFNRQSGIYTYILRTEYKVKLNNHTLFLPEKIIFKDDYQRFRRKFETIHSIEFKSNKLEIIEKNTVIPFGNYERKFKFSGKTSEILDDLINFKSNNIFSFSDDLLDNRNFPIYGIDSKLDYPTYLLKCENNNKSKNRFHNHDVLYKYDEDIINFIKDALSIIGIHYDISQIGDCDTFIMFPLPYIQIIQNRLDTESLKEKIIITIKKNNNLFNVFRHNSLKLKYNINELNSDFTEENFLEIPYTRKEIQTIEIEPNNVKKIGKCKIEIFLNNVTVNKFYGTYLRDIKIETILKKYE
ncbi:hypothetical protein GCM10011508_11270 [Flavobacterium lutivivi]|nr:hypothetical protein GCM10011508_11270 [Flavobacterium lutivivi]